MRSKIVGLLSGVVLLLGAGSAFAATETLAPADAGRGYVGDHEHTRRHVVIGRITDTNRHTFTLATRWGDDVKVRWDDDTIFRGGDKHDLKKGTIVGVLGERDKGKIDAKLIFFPRHDDHDRGHR